MLVPFVAKTKDGGGDAPGLISLMERCQAELEGVRQDIAWHGGHRGVAEVQARLSRTAECLDQAIGWFVRLQRLADDQRSTRAAAPILVREAEHRVKNGMTTVIGLLHRQAATTTDVAVGQALRVAGARVAVVAQMHALLGNIGLVGEEDREIALEAYLPALGDAILSAMDGDHPRPIVKIAIEPLSVTPNTAQTIGLIMAELVTNTLRHAFKPGRPGTIDVTGERVEGAYLLCVRDDGRGIPDVPSRVSGLGLRLVGMLAGQLQARLVIDSTSGTRATLVLKEPLTA